MTEPRVFTTAEWGARAPKHSFTQQPARGIVIHNMENANRAPQTGDAEVQAAVRVARENQRSHMDDRGFADTGQHFTISRGGIILEGRHGSLAAARSGQVVQSAHAGVDEQNKFWFGIELEGDNQQSFVVTAQQFNALTELCAFLAHQSHLDPPKIEPHNKFHSTTCPGHIVEHMDELRARVKARLGELAGGGGNEGSGAGHEPAGEGTHNPTSQPRVHLKGKMSTFGGPHDTGVSPSEGLALVEPSQLEELKEFFLPTQPPGTTGLARRLNPDKFYIACRWNFSVTPKTELRHSFVQVRNPQNGKTAQAKPVGFGPHETTGRVADLSPGLARFLELETDDEVEVTLA